MSYRRITGLAPRLVTRIGLDLVSTCFYLSLVTYPVLYHKCLSVLLVYLESFYYSGDTTYLWSRRVFYVFFVLSDPFEPPSGQPLFRAD